ncbi:hypothetical protein OAG71_02400 [bacterium]|nr:hypothetical protein [bacterium]
MRRRRRTQQGDSFDLFLDTITNTFGGVLLIALLIVLMIRENTEGAPKDYQSGPTADLQVIQSAIKALEAERDSLVTGLQDQKVFSEDFIDGQLKELSKELSAKISERIKLSAEAAMLSRLVEQASVSNTRLAAKGEQVKSDLAKSAAEFKKLSEQLAAEDAARTQTMTLPKEQRTSKSEVPVFFEGGQVFVVKKDRRQISDQINTQHFQKTTAGRADLLIDSEYYSVRSGAGLSLGSESLKTELERYPANRYYFAIVVRTDSFGRFSKLRSICVKSGFEYRIIATDGIIGEGGSGGRTQ